MTHRKSGQGRFQFSYQDDLRTLPERARGEETSLHGSFAVDKRPEAGHVYYGMPGTGLLRVSPDLSSQDLIELPDDLRPVNFHSTKIGIFDGKRRLFLAANKDAMVAVVTLDGDVDFIIPRPEFEQYADQEAVFAPTDTALVGTTLYVSDGYGSNYITTNDLASRSWQGIFGGKTDDPTAEGKFGTAHGLSVAPDGRHLTVADRPHSRLQVLSMEGRFVRSYQLPAGSRPCGIDFFEYRGGRYAVVGSLDDPQEGRAAPIYILRADTFSLVSTIRPKDDLGIEPADHIHNVVWHEHEGRCFLVCQAWNPGYYFVLELEE